MIISEKTMDLGEGRSVTLALHEGGVFTIALEDPISVAVTEISRELLQEFIDTGSLMLDAA
jgi:hypothetical protein